MPDHSPIHPPDNPALGRNLRRLAIAIVGAVPGIGSFIAEAADEIIPDPETEDRKRWENEITAAVNWLQNFVGFSSIPSTAGAWQIAYVAWDLDIAAKGEVSVTEADVLQRLPNLSVSELDEGIAELEYADWISSWPDANSRTGCGGFHAKSLLFAFVDPIKGTYSPTDDAKAIAEYALTREDAVSSTEIDDHFRWKPRRLYPALWFLSQHIVPYACDNYYLENYPFAWLTLTGESRRQLRVFSQ